MKNKTISIAYYIILFVFMMFLFADTIDILMYEQQLIPNSLRLPLFLIWVCANALRSQYGGKSAPAELSGISRGE